MSDDATEPLSTREEMEQRLKQAEEAPPEAEGPASAPSTDAEETSAPEGTEAPAEDATDESFTTFNIADVPEEYRPHVEQIHRQLQSDYTKKRQSEAERVRQAESALAFVDALQSEEQRADALKQIADAFGPEAVLDALGFEIDDPDAPDVGQATELDDVDTDDPIARLEAQIHALQAEREVERQQQQTAQEQQQEQELLDRIDEHVTSEIDALTSIHGEISEDEEELIVGHALANLPPDANGMPQIRKAYESLNGVWNARQKRWAKSKETTHVAPGGTAATQVPDLDQEMDRRDFMAEQLARLEREAPGN